MATTEYYRIWRTAWGRCCFEVGAKSAHQNAQASHAADRGGVAPGKVAAAGVTHSKKRKFEYCSRGTSARAPCFRARLFRGPVGLS